MKLMPAARPLAMMRSLLAASVRPPNIIVPRQIGETLRPLRPSRRYSILSSVLLLRGPAAIHRDGSAGDRRGGVAAQVHGEGAEMLGGGELQHRLLLLEQVFLRPIDRNSLLLRVVLDLLLHQRRQHPARTDRVAGD